MYCRVLGAKYTVNVESGPGPVRASFRLSCLAFGFRLWRGVCLPRAAEEGGRDLSRLRTDLPLEDVVEWRWDKCKDEHGKGALS